MRKSSQGFAYILLLVIFVPMAIAITSVAKNIADKYGPAEILPPAEERTVSLEATPSPVPKATLTPSLPKESELTSLNETWNQYTNYQLGFSIKVPKEMLHYYGSCKWNEEGGDHSYRPNPALVPVKIHEDKENNTAYITSEYYHELAGETIENYVSYHSKCNKVPNSLERIRRELRAERGHYQQAWDIIVRNVASDSQLDSFIKERYGPGCALSGKKPSEQQGVFDIGIDIEDKTVDRGNLEELARIGCVVNYMTVLRYYSAKNKVVSWHLGQAYTFYKVLGEVKREDIVYDNEMAESFRFLK